MYEIRYTKKVWFESIFEYIVRKISTVFLHFSSHALQDPLQCKWVPKQGGAFQWPFVTGHSLRQKLSPRWRRAPFGTSDRRVNRCNRGWRWQVIIVGTGAQAIKPGAWQHHLVGCYSNVRIIVAAHFHLPGYDSEHGQWNEEMSRMEAYVVVGTGFGPCGFYVMRRLSQTGGDSASGNYPCWADVSVCVHVQVYMRALSLYTWARMQLEHCMQTRILKDKMIKQTSHEGLGWHQSYILCDVWPRRNKSEEKLNSTSPSWPFMYFLHFVLML